MASITDGRTTGTRQRILYEASNLFAARGYHATTTREIADAVGIRQPSLFHHFRSKGEILQVLLTSDLDRSVALVESAASSPGPAADRLYDFLVADVELVCGSPYNLSGVYTDEVMADPDFQPWVEKNRRFEDAIEKMVRDGIDAGEFRRVDAAFVRDAVEGILLRALMSYSGGRAAPTNLAHDVATFVLRALLVDPAAMPSRPSDG